MPDPQPQPGYQPLHRLHVTDHKDIKVVSFIENKILDEANITEIEQGLTSLVKSREQPKLLLDFQNVEHLSSAALGMLINVNAKIRERSGELRLVNIKAQIMAAAWTVPGLEYPKGLMSCAQFICALLTCECVTRHNWLRRPRRTAP